MNKKVIPMDREVIKKKENNVFETLFDIVPFGIYVVDVKTYELVYLNSLFKKKFGDYANKKCYQLIFGNERPCMFCKIPELVSNGEIVKEVVDYEQFNDKIESWYRFEDRGIFWPDGRLVKYSIGIDITKEKMIQNDLAEAHARLILQARELENKNKKLMELYDKTKNIAERDYLTGLYNRRFFYEIGDKMLSQVKRRGINSFLSVLDIDFFKSINDTYGHAAGDEVLRYFSNILKDSFRKSDLVGRIGGEEFGILLVDLDEDSAERLLEGLLKKIEMSEICISDHKKVSITISIGVTKIFKEDFDSAMLTADNMMYQAKKKGRNGIVFFNNHL